jgi:hypothetical protein
MILKLWKAIKPLLYINRLYIAILDTTQWLGKEVLNS